MDSKGKMKMTIDEAIKYYLDIADGQDKCADISVSEHAKERMRVCAANNRQLAEWLTELKEAKLFLKSAAKIVNSSLCCDDDLCSECVHSEECKYSVDYDRCFEWKYKNTEEYKKLIGDD